MPKGNNPEGKNQYKGLVQGFTKLCRGCNQYKLFSEFPPNKDYK